MPNLFVIIAAAGAGTRLGHETPKQFIPVNGYSILHHTLTQFITLPSVAKIMVVLPAQDQYFQYDQYADHPLIATCEGAMQRSLSVAAGLDALSDHAMENDWILVHDAARPFVAQLDIEKLLHETADSTVGGLLVAPVVDTIKQVEANRVSTLPRGQLYRALTPQVFRYGLLKQALHHAHEHQVSVTDDASAIELIGHTPVCVLAEHPTDKVTYVTDLTQCEHLLSEHSVTSKSQSS